MKNSECSHEISSTILAAKIPALFKTHDGFAGPNAFITDETALSIQSLVWLNMLAADKHPSSSLAQLAPYQELLILWLS